MRPSHLSLAAFTTAAALLAPAHAGPATVRGKLLGKPFDAVAACVSSVRADGRASFSIDQAKNYDVKLSCGTLGPDEGNRELSLSIPWKDGGKLDVDATTKGYVTTYGKGGAPEVRYLNQDFKATGTFEVIRAGAKAGDIGRVKVSFVTGSDKVEGEIDVYQKRDPMTP